MTDEQSPVSEGEQEPQEATQEQNLEQQPEEKQDRMVPLAALEAERRKRQEMEAENRIYQQQMSVQQTVPETPPEDEDDWVTKKEYRQSVAKDLSSAKREILEEAFVQTNPEAYGKVNDYLPELIKQKPWVKDVVENAPNRWQRAWELVKELHMPQQQQRQQKSQDAQRIVENTQKPGSPASANKSVTANKVDYLRGIRGTAEWDEYRSKLRRG